MIFPEIIPGKISYQQYCWSKEIMCSLDLVDGTSLMQMWLSKIIINNVKETMPTFEKLNKEN